MKDNKSMTAGDMVAESIDFKSWPLDLQVDYILKIHHRNIRKQGPEIEKLLDKVCQTHGKEHPILYTVKELFYNSIYDLNMHLDKEELVLFPYIYEMVKAKLDNIAIREFQGGSIAAPISVMMAEHDAEEERYRKIDDLTIGYTAPEDACDNYRLVMQQLKDFVAALHQHINMENDIVFPGALALEAELKERP